MIDKSQVASTTNDKTKDDEEEEEIDINNMPDLLTVREVADLLRVSTLTIKRWVKRGKLSAIRINTRGDLRFKKESVMWLLGIEPEES